MVFMVQNEREGEEDGKYGIGGSNISHRPVPGYSDFMKKFVGVIVFFFFHIFHHRRRRFMN